MSPMGPSPQIATVDPYLFLAAVILHRPNIFPAKISDSKFEYLLDVSEFASVISGRDDVRKVKTLFVGDIGGQGAAVYVGPWDSYVIGLGWSASTTRSTTQEKLIKFSTIAYTEPQKYIFMRQSRMYKLSRGSAAPKRFIYQQPNEKIFRKFRDVHDVDKLQRHT